MRSKSHKIAVCLGWLGAIPFVGSALMSFTNDPALIFLSAELASRYGLAIVIFLGSIHWGIAMTDQSYSSSLRYLWSVTPALIATLVFFIEPASSLLIVIGLLIICWGVDMMFYLNTALPAWYSRLRHGLTLTAVISLTIVAVRLPV